MKLKNISCFFMVMAAVWIVFALIDAFVGDAASVNHNIQMSFLCIIISLIADMQDNINNLRHP